MVSVAAQSEIATEIVGFWKGLFDGVVSVGPLFLCIAKRSIEKDSFNQQFFTWPDQAEDAARFAMAADARGEDAYFCAHLLNDARRKKESAAQVMTLWADVDAGDHTLGPEPSLRVESSPGRCHTYYRLDTTLDPVRAESLNKSLAVMIGADKGGHDLTQLLRVPYTHNRKPQYGKEESSPEVRIVERDGPIYRKADLDLILPLVQTSESPSPIDGSAPPVRLSKRGEDLWSGRETIKKDNGDVDRSETLYALAGELWKSNASGAGIVTMLAEFDKRLGFNKYVDRPEQYVTIAAKVCAEVSPPIVPPAVLRWSRDINANPSPPPVALVDNLFLRGQIGLIGGATYAGKSLFGMDLAVSLAAGRNVLDHPELAVFQAVPVAYVYAEQGEVQWERRLFAVERHRGVSTDIPVALISGYDLGLRDAERRASFITQLKGASIEVVVFDPLAVLFPSEDENDASKAIAATRAPLEEFVRQGITPIVIHHSRKAAKDFEPYTASDLVRGSGDIIAMTGTVVGVWDGKKAGIKVVTQGRTQTARPFRLIKREVSGSSLYESDTVSIEEHMCAEMRVLTYDGVWEKESSEDEVLGYLAKSGKATVKEITDAVGFSKRTVERHLKKLGPKVRNIGRGAYALAVAHEDKDQSC
jgi:hypothetical protein